MSASKDARSEGMKAFFKVLKNGVVEAEKKRVRASRVSRLRKPKLSDSLRNHWRVRNEDRDRA
jgi:hypothetical protein